MRGVLRHYTTMSMLLSNYHHLTPLGHLRVRFLPILRQKCKQKQTLFTWQAATHSAFFLLHTSCLSFWPENGSRVDCWSCQLCKEGKRLRWCAQEPWDHYPEFSSGFPQRRTQESYKAREKWSQRTSVPSRQLRRDLKNEPQLINVNAKRVCIRGGSSWDKTAVSFPEYRGEEVSL